MHKRFSLLLLICAFLFASGFASVSSNGKIAKNYGSMKDPRDGQIYKTVQIGDQVWMAENLNYETRDAVYSIDSDFSGFLTNGSHKSKNIRNKRSKKVTLKSETSYCYDNRTTNCLRYGRLYPWSTAVEACPVGWHLPDTTEWNTLFATVGGIESAGKVLKFTEGWRNGGNGTDEYGFSALPVGFRYELDSQSPPNEYASFWSSTDDPEKGAYGMFLNYYNNGAKLGFDSYAIARSVRCLKGVKLSSSSSAMATSSSSSQETSVDADVSVVTESGTMVDSRDGRTYKTLKVGSWTWMAENLKYKTSDSYCFGDKAENCEKYGRLYTSDAMRDSSSLNAEQGLCPVGWHLPSQWEWERLIDAVGGDSLAGKRLKKTMGWFGDSAKADDDVGFSVLPAGIRFSDGSYSREGLYSLFWISATNGVFFNYYSPRTKMIVELSKVGASVRCIKDIAIGTLVDHRDGQTYKTVKIGKQNWMAENLRFKSPNSFCYNNADSNCTKYGRLYLWTAALDSVRLYKDDDEDCGYCKPCPPKFPLRGVCPKGWHIPTETEWMTLLETVEKGTSSGVALKSTTGWKRCDYGHHFFDRTCKPGGNGYDYFGFSAVPAGRWNKDGGKGIGESAMFWSSTGYYKSAPNYMSLSAEKEKADVSYCSGSDYKNDGLSVRCIQDEVESADLGALQTKEEKRESKPSAQPTVAKNDGRGINYGTLKDSRDGQTYRTVTIGEQTWMAENLKYKTQFSTCHKDPDSCAKYGRLYEWGEAYNACPADWHLPTEDEWNTLFATLGVERRKYDGFIGAGEKLKSKEGWLGNGNGTDEYGFSALPAGQSNYYSEVFNRPNTHKGVGTSAYFWSVDVDPSFSNSFLTMESGTKRAFYMSGSDRNAISVRCIKNKPLQNKTYSAMVPVSSVVKDSLIDDRDGQVYKTVKIGSQTWMAQNLNYETNDSRCYKNDYHNCSKYGRFYTWNDAVKACPAGWHLPDTTEWNTLFASVGGRLTASKFLKSKSGWETCKNWCWANGNGSDDYGFSVLPVDGWGYNHEFGSEGRKAEFWTASVKDRDAYYIYLVASYSYTIYFNRNFNYYGRSVRCVKDSD
ncbi:fibrobacter succinogenes major paralogous domain-containing protein [Fibrobacter sp.]|uniref:fibrobacter succinogenes major paralogous domain-containing protein n=1 Tax=Fibrobacter sp. TaxID=35828 RepID=UPI0025BF5EF8|nr:fibrobacter succinogenes major paralogous domain-containing protein [Fibrobacter sp.]MBR3070479.1 fibrobacter succinogenes major paralogous domain-containing protein [Fibrobacter sp.]